MRDYYNASWGKLLYVTTIFGTAILVGVPLCALAFSNTATGVMMLIVGVLPLIILVGCVLYTVKGFSFHADSLIVHRLFWNTRIPLNGIKVVEFKTGVADRALRTFGNGGLFGFYGKYWNKKLGHFNAYITDFSNTVVLKLENQVVVVSPENPEEFVEHVQGLTQFFK